jgi:hypothetical protein
MTLAEHLAAAEQAVVEPRERVQRLRQSLDTAVAAGEYGEAEQLKNQLHAATEDLVIAEAAVRALGEGAVRAEQERTAASRRIAEAQQRAQAERDLEAARAEEQRRLSQMNDAVSALWPAVAEAQQRLQSALAFQDAVAAAQTRQIDARRRLGEFGNDPGPKAPGANAVSVLVERKPLLTHLAAWSR